MCCAAGTSKPIKEGIEAVIAKEQTAIAPLLSLPSLLSHLLRVLATLNVGGAVHAPVIPGGNPTTPSADDDDERGAAWFCAPKDKASDVKPNERSRSGFKTQANPSLEALQDAIERGLPHLVLEKIASLGVVPDIRPGHEPEVYAAFSAAVCKEAVVLCELLGDPPLLLSQVVTGVTHD